MADLTYVDPTTGRPVQAAPAAPSYYDPTTGRVGGNGPSAVRYDPSSGYVQPVDFSAALQNARQQPAAPARPQNTSNFVWAGLKSGTDEAIKSLGGFGAALGSALGSQGLQDAGQNLAQRYGDYAAAASRPDLEEAPWYSPTAFGYHVAQAIPGIGAVIGGTAAAAVAGAPALLGGALVGAPLAAGAFMNTAMEQPGGAQPGDAARALALGLPIGAAQAYMPASLGRIIEKGAEGDIIKRIATSALVPGALSGVQAGVQTAVDQTFGDPNKSVGDRAADIVQSVLSGAAIGGVMGGAVGALSRRKPASITNGDLSGAVDDATGRAAPSPEQSAPAAGGATTPAPASEGVKTYSDYTSEQLQDMHQQLTKEAAEGDQSPMNMQVRQRIEAELNGRDVQLPTQQLSLDLGTEPTGEQPGSKAFREQQEAAAAQQKTFVDAALQANKGKASQFTKVLEKNPVNTPEEFAASIYDNYRPTPQMKTLAGKLGLLDETGKLFTPETLQAAAQQAERDNLLQQTKDSTQRVQQLEQTSKLLQTIMEARQKSAEVPAFEEPARAEAAPAQEPLLKLGDVEQPGLPLGLPQPGPLDGVQTPNDLLRAVTGNDKAVTRSNAPTAEADLARIYAADKLGPVNAKLLEHVGLAEGGEKLSFDDALSRLNAEREDAQARGDAQKLGEVDARAQQVDRLKTLVEHNAAQDTAAEAIQTPTLGKAFKALETIRRQLPPEMANAAERVQDMQAKLIAADGTGRTGAAGQASQLVNLLKERLAQHRDGETADLTPLKAPAPAGEPSAAAQQRVAQIQQRQTSTGPKQGPKQLVARVKPEELTPAAQADLQKLGMKVQPDLASVTYPEARTQIDTDIDHIVANGGSTADALAHMAENHPDPYVRQLAQWMGRFKVDPKIEYASRDGVDFETAHANQPDAFVPASYNPGLDRINIYDRSNMAGSVLHEAVHAATLPALDKGTSAAREMNRLFDTVKSRELPQGSDFYGMSNVKEFVSEAFSNPRFRASLQNQGVETGSRLGNLWQGFKNAVFRMLNMPERMRSMFDQVMDAGNKLMEESAAAKDAVGSVPDVERQAQGMMAEVPQVLQKVSDALKNAKLGPAERKKLTYAANGWWTRGAIAQRTPQLGQGARDFELTHIARSAQNNQLNQMSTAVDAAVRALPEKAQSVITRLTTLYDQLGIDPSKSAAQHTWLHSAENFSELKPLIEQGNQDLRTLKQVGGDAALKGYRDMATTNRALWYARLNSVADFYIPKGWTDQFPGFDKTAVDRYQFADQLHGDVQGTHDFFKSQFETRMAPIGEFLMNAENEARAVEALGDRASKKEARAMREKVAALGELYGVLQRGAENGEQVPNFHKGRYGDHVVTAAFASENGKITNPAAVQRVRDMLDKVFGENSPAIYAETGNPRLMMRFENLDHARTAESILQKAMQDGLIDKEHGVKYGDVSTHVVADVMPKRLMDMMDRVLNSDQFQLREEATDKEREAMERARSEVRSMLVHAYMDTIPDNAVQTILRARKFVQGSSDNVLRNFVHRNQILANSVTNMAAQPKINAAVSSMLDRLREMGEAKRFNSELGRKVSLDEIDAGHAGYRALMMGEWSRPMRVENNILDLARSWTHSYFLGFSPSYVVMQMIQPAQTTLPELGKHFGFARSGAELIKTGVDVMKIMKTLIAEPGRIDGVITRDKLMKSGVSQATVDAVMDMVNRGHIDISAPTRELGRIASGRSADWSEKLPRLANTVPMWSETMSRLIAGLATHRLFESAPEKARMPGFKYDPTMSAADRSEMQSQYVGHVIRETLGRYGSGETPFKMSQHGFAGKATPLITTFMQYYAGMFEKLTREMGTAFGKYGANAEERAAARRYLVGHTAAMAVISGTMGIPFFNAITGAATKALNLTTGKDDWDVAAAYRNFTSDIFGGKLGDVVARGVPRAMGLDFSHLGEQDMLPFTQLLTDRRKMEEALPDFAVHLLGSGVAATERIYTGLRDIMQGRPLEGAIKVMPTALRNPLEAYRLGEYGALDSANRKLPIPNDAAAVLAQALGLKTGAEANYQEASQTMKQLEASRQFRSANIKLNLMTALDRGDQAGVQKALGEATKFSLDHPAQAMMQLGSEYFTRKEDEAYAAARGMPLGLRPLDQNTYNQLRFNVRQQ